MKREKIESSILLIFFILSLVICGYWVYFRLAYSDKTWTAYKGSVLSYTEEKIYPIEINYFSNKNGNGVPLIEFKMSGYTDTSLVFNENTQTYEYKDVYVNGLQFYSVDIKDNFYDNKDDMFLNKQLAWILKKTYRIKNVNYFYSFNKSSFCSTESFTAEDGFIIDLGGLVARLSGKGYLYDNSHEYIYDKDNFNAWKIYKHDFNFFYHFIIQNVISGFNNGVNTYVLDLSEFFDIEIFNEEDGRFHNLSESSDLSIEKVYLTCKVSKSDDGFVSSKQSLFGFYKNDSDYGSNTSDYWKSLTDYTITERDLIYTKISENDNTYTAKLSDECINYLSKFSDMNIDLKIDLDSYYLSNRNIEIYALEKDFLQGLKVSNVSIISETQKTIYLYETLDNLSLTNVNVEVLT